VTEKTLGNRASTTYYQINCCKMKNSIIIQPENLESYFEYSINGIDFQANQFSYIPTGQYTAFVRQ
jgi:hypothetical protein